MAVYAVHTDSDEEQVNRYVDKVATSYTPHTLVLSVEVKSNTLQFWELPITIDAYRLSCCLWNSVAWQACNTGSGDTMLTRLLTMIGGTHRIGRLSWVVGAICRLTQGCFGDAGLVMSLPDLKLEMKIRVRWTGLLQSAISRVEHPLAMKGNAAAGRAAMPGEGAFEVVT